MHMDMMQGDKTCDLPAWVKDIRVRTGLHMSCFLYTPGHIAQVQPYMLKRSQTCR